MSTFDEFLKILRKVRKECPWDREQTPSSLKPYLLEEAFEVAEAIDKGGLCEELGDLLLEIAFQVELAEERGEFSWEDVFDSINKKLIRRHPHIFGGERKGWEEVKREEGRSVLSGVPDMPALMMSQALQRRAQRVGFDWERREGVFEKIREEIEELEGAKSYEEKKREYGDLLFAIANAARWDGIELEEALREANKRFKERFELMEKLCEERGLRMEKLPLEELDKLWEEAKKLSSGGDS